MIRHIEDAKEFMLIDDEPDWVFTLRIPKTAESGEDNDLEMDTVLGVVNKSKNEVGFAFRIDMSYKGKSDQWTSNFMELSAFYSVEEFEEICKQHGIDVAYE